MPTWGFPCDKNKRAGAWLSRLGWDAELTSRYLQLSTSSWVFYFYSSGPLQVGREQSVPQSSHPVLSEALGVLWGHLRASWTLHSLSMDLFILHVCFAAVGKADPTSPAEETTEKMPKFQVTPPWQEAKPLWCFFLAQQAGMSSGF